MSIIQGPGEIPALRERSLLLARLGDCGAPGAAELETFGRTKWRGRRPATVGRIDMEKTSRGLFLNEGLLTQWVITILLTVFVAATSARAAERDPSINSSLPKLPAFQIPNQSNIIVLRLNGGTTPLLVTEDEHINTRPIWLRDESGLIFESDRDGDFELYQYNFLAKTTTALTENDAIDSEPALLALENRLLFTSDRDGALRIYETYLDRNETTCLTCGLELSGYHYSPAYIRNGSAILFVNSNNDLTSSTLYRLTLIDKKLELLAIEPGVIERTVLCPSTDSIYYTAEPDADRYSRLWTIGAQQTKALVNLNAITGPIYHPELLVEENKLRLLISTPSVDERYEHGLGTHHDIISISPVDEESENLTDGLDIGGPAGFFHPAISPSGEQVAFAAYRSTPKTVARHKWAKDIREWSRYIHAREGWFILGKQGAFLTLEQNRTPPPDCILIMPGSGKTKYQLVHMGPVHKGVFAIVDLNGTIEVTDPEFLGAPSIATPLIWPKAEPEGNLRLLEDHSIYSSTSALSVEEIALLRSVESRMFINYKNELVVLNKNTNSTRDMLFMQRGKEAYYTLGILGKSELTPVIEIASDGGMEITEHEHILQDVSIVGINWPYYGPDLQPIPPVYDDVFISLTTGSDYETLVSPAGIVITVYNK